MLIIAQPKSASTSLMVTLAALMGKQCEQQLKLPSFKIRELFPQNEFKFIHSDGGNIPKVLLEEWIYNRNIIYKQHLLPTSWNCEQIRKIQVNEAKILLITRDPSSIPNSYRRSNIKKVNLPEIYKTLSKNKDEQIIQEQEKFIKTWKFNLTEYLEIKFERLIKDPAYYINECLEFWNSDIRVVDNWKLPKITWQQYESNQYSISI